MNGSAASSALVQPLRTLFFAVDKRARLLLLGTLLLVFGGSTATAAVPVLFKYIVDRLSQDGYPPGPVMAVFLVSSYAVVAWFGRALSELRSLVHGRAEQRIRARLIRRTFLHVLSLPLTFHSQYRTVGLTQTLADGLTGYRTILQHLTLTVLPVIVEVAAIASVLVYLEQRTFLAIIAGSILLYVAAFRAGLVAIRRPAQMASSSQIEASAIFAESVANYEAVKYFGAERHLEYRLNAAVLNSELCWNSMFAVKARSGLVVAAIFSGSVFLSLYLAAMQVQRGAMSLGTFVLINTYVLQVARPVEMLGFALRDLGQAMAFVQRLTEVLQQKTAARTFTESFGSLPDRPHLLLHDITYSYGQSGKALDAVRVSIPHGRTVAIVGRSGCGKSTLVRILGRLIKPASGTVLLGGVDLWGIPTAELKRMVAIAPQDPSLFNETIGYNIAFGREGCTCQEIVRVAAIAHIHDFIRSLDSAYETRVGERGVTLSGGQKQRLAIARALVGNPAVLILDESTSSLDLHTERLVLRDVAKYRSGRTTIIVAHRLSAITQADEIVVLDSGRIAEHGSHDELLRIDGIYAGLWSAQFACPPSLRVAAD